MQENTSNKIYGRGYAGDQDATKWEYYTSKQFQEISYEDALELHNAKLPYQLVEFIDVRPISISSIKLGFPNFIYREFRWDEGSAINLRYDALEEPKERAFLSSFSWFGYESLYIPPIYRIDVYPKRNSIVYFGFRNLLTGEHTLDNGHFDIGDLWMPIPEFDAYDELRRWQREPVFTLANRLIQEAKQRWNLP